MQVSEADLEEVRADLEGRLAAAERRAYALAKERDALRRTADGMAAVNAQLAERDDTIKQVGLASRGRGPGARLAAAALVRGRAARPWPEP